MTEEIRVGDVVRVIIPQYSFDRGKNETIGKIVRIFSDANGFIDNHSVIEIKLLKWNKTTWLGCKPLDYDTIWSYCRNEIEKLSEKEALAWLI